MDLGEIEQFLYFEMSDRCRCDSINFSSSIVLLAQQNTTENKINIEIEHKNVHKT